MEEEVSYLRRRGSPLLQESAEAKRSDYGVSLPSETDANNTVLQQKANLQATWLNLWSGFISLGVLLAFFIFGLFVSAERINIHLPTKKLPDLSFALPAVLLVELSRLRIHLDLKIRFFNVSATAGGLRFVTFQALGWSFFGLSIVLPCLPWLAAYFIRSRTQGAYGVCWRGSRAIRDYDCHFSAHI